jgi:hypothetical protein
MQVGRRIGERELLDFGHRSLRECDSRIESGAGRHHQTVRLDA